MPSKQGSGFFCLHAAVRVLGLGGLIGIFALAPLGAQAGSPDEDSSTTESEASSNQPDEAEAVSEVITVVGMRETLQTARERRREAENLVEVIAADAVGELPDANIAEALNRVTGVYLRPDQGEGRYVSIRGVDPILNNVTLNGQTIAVSDSDGRSGRAAPLDVLSASSLSFIEVHKVTLPNMDGQSIGGTVNVKTPSAFDLTPRHGTVKLDVGTNDLGSESDIYSVGGDFGTQFGSDDQFGLYIGANYWFREYLSHLYENPRAGFSESGFSDVLFPDRVRFGSAVGERERTNYTANLEYRATDASRYWLRYYDTQYDDLELRPEFTIRNRGDIGATSPTDFFWTRYRIENETRLESQERPVDQIVLGGDQVLGTSWSLRGNLNFTEAKELNPFLNYYETETQSDRGSLDDPANAPIHFTLSPDGFATPVYNPAFTDGLTPNDFAFHQLSRVRNITSEVLEDTYTANLDAAWNGLWGDRATTFQTGVKVLSRDKSVDDDDNRFPYRGSDTLALAGLGESFSDIGQGEPYFLVPSGTLPIPSPDSFEAHRAANPGDYTFDERGSASNSIEDDYTMEENIVAAYAMVSVDVGDTVNITGGVRIEETEVDVAACAFINSVETELDPSVSRVDELPFGSSDVLDVANSHDYSSVLPSILLKWAINDEWLMRASVSTNIGRPDYPDTAPISTLTVVEDFFQPGNFFAFNEIGNPDLEPYESTNFDVSLDYYLPNNGGLLNLGAFYKTVDNAIYDFTEELDDFEFAGVLFDEYTSFTKYNADSGHISGLEFSYQQDFRQLPGAWDGLGFLGNVAFIDSEVEVEQRPGEQLPFFNQADLIYNIQLYYEKYRFSARVALAHQSEAIFDELGPDPENDIFRAESTTIDARLAYQITDDIGIFLAGRNLTDEQDLTYRNRNERFIAENPGYEVYGREFRLGLNWSWR